MHSFQLALMIVLLKCILFRKPASISLLEASVLTPQLKSLSTPLGRPFIGRRHKYCHHQNGAENNIKVIGLVCGGLLPWISLIRICCDACKLQMEGRSLEDSKLKSKLSKKHNFLKWNENPNEEKIQQVYVGHALIGKILATVLQQQNRRMLSHLSQI